MRIDDRLTVPRGTPASRVRLAVRAALLPGTCAAACVAACVRPAWAQGASARTPVPPGAWETLFDGRGAAPLAAWRGYRRQDVPAAWRVVGHTLAVVPESALAVIRRTGDRVGANGDLVTRDSYGDFELAFTWRIARGGNSGVFYRVAESDSNAWQTGPEFQLLDDAHHANGRYPTHRAGAIFDLVAPPPGAARPAAGDARWTPWQQGRVVMRGGRVQQYLNGRLVATLDFASPAGRAVVAGSSFRARPGFARAAEGHVGLQNQGNAVQFRDVRIRRLGGGT